MKKTKPVRAPKVIIPHIRKLFAHPISGLKALWSDPVWSKVIASIIVGVLGVTLTSGIYFLRSPSSTDRLEKAQITSHHNFIESCKTVTITGSVEPNGVETFAWFEWRDAKFGENDS